MAHRDSLTILHSLAPAPIGGLESVVRALTTGHRALGHRIVVAAIVEEPGHPFVHSLRSLGIDVTEVYAASREIQKQRSAMTDLIRTQRPDIVHTHGYRPDILDLPLAQRFGIPTVSSLHGFTGGDWKIRLYEYLQIRAIRRADAITAASQSVYDRVHATGIPANKLHLIPNAYASTTLPQSREAARTQLGISEQEFRIAWIGRLSHEKGADIMVEAMTELTDLPIRLSIVGDGQERDRLQMRIESLQLGSRIMMHGALADAAQLIPAFDAFVLSSRTEGTPMVVLETMAVNVPIIATRVGGIPHMLSKDEAMLVPPENPHELAAAIRALYYDRTTAQARTEHAKQRLEKEFATTPWLERFALLYQSLLS